jgi:hypothetical protein
MMEAAMKKSGLISAALMCGLVLGGCATYDDDYYRSGYDSWGQPHYGGAYYSGGYYGWRDGSRWDGDRRHYRDRDRDYERRRDNDRHRGEQRWNDDDRRDRQRAREERSRESRARNEEARRHIERGSQAGDAGTSRPRTGSRQEMRIRAQRQQQHDMNSQN